MENSFKEKSITDIKGIKDVRAKAFARLGVYTVGDLLSLCPIRYENRAVVKKIDELKQHDEVSVIAYVNKIVKKTLRRNLTLYTVTVSDGTGNLQISFYNQNYIQQTLKYNYRYIFFGTVTQGFGSTLVMQNPVFEKADDENAVNKFTQLQPIYPLVNGLTQKTVRNAVSEALKLSREITSVNETDSDAHIRTMSGINSRCELPVEILKEFNLMKEHDAKASIHFPKSITEAEEARRRLAFDELLELQLMLFNMKRNCDRNGNMGIRFSKTDITELTSTLPFELTDSQKSVWDDIESDMESQKIMNRLVIGDVGSGKTIVAVMAMFKAIRNGYQAVYMAPTEILAEQHYSNIRRFLEPLGITVGLLTGALTAKNKREIKKEIALGNIACIIGTQALIQDGMQFFKPGIVITDEQHRFGVRQRAMLSNKETMPDILVMTATPIPRTLALILYGDMDISSIKTLPTGRLPIKTYLANSDMHYRVYTWVRKLVKEGQQAYIVHPMIETNDETEDNGIVSATENYMMLSDTAFEGIPTALLHGKMKGAEKDEIMRRFASGEIRVLFTTTVVEVGVDVSNATVMVIENAERFGLAQLHQLRGRVGRGALQSHCTLITDSKSELVKKRMKVMTSGCDGFAISEKDLELRGPGEFFGTAQHGIPAFKVANLYEDIPILKDAQRAAAIIAEKADEAEFKEYIEYIASRITDMVQL
ncbi:MAG: ATP-dependent DNA helicase RecG [Clostridia bacterium]|nr:ATP-dependent DNA helicase RecG [Clostridia bacterium]